MLARLKLPPLQERRRDHRLAFFYKVVGGELPGVPPDRYVNQVRGKRKIIPKKNKDFVTKNIVDQMARNNCRSFTMQDSQTVQSPQSAVFKNSFFPRTVREWNTLDDAAVNAESVEDFKTRLPTSTTH